MKNNTDPIKNADLVLKYLRGELNAAEEEAFANWLSQHKANKAFFQAVQDKEKIKEELDFYASIDTQKNRQELAQKIQPEPEGI